MILLDNINKTFVTPGGKFQAISSASLEVDQGDIYGIIGFSGAGKSTLLRTINLLEKPDSGSVIVEGEDLTLLTKKQLLKKRMSMGMIFQNYNLIGNRTVFDNVSFPLEIAGVSKSERRKKIRECLEIVGLSDKADHYPVTLSGGQKQRVAIARTMVTQPKILLCDEPTSALDPQTTESILAFLKELNEKSGITIVIVTHEMEVIKSICNKVSVMENGHVVEKFQLKDPNFVPQTRITKFLFNNEIEVRREGEGVFVG
ncbi:methionine ABC transporter ATP-binding protein [Paenibacillus validus]|uniref:methionine ABC transporter ATP-binding protein n=1 Tax=Paenibacillus validus TaxID=44253 RepID=UPI000FD98105|nr:methionine ABC transporter ATP-binding protein [Paenibacillus validus]MED4601154.1 methionine ABC transporter ATP-binding protein [Paenibacillus validus]MED4606878.1 methionine ABC transporter ATP-binding protein [Paenibacillus validus]